MYDFLWSGRSDKFIPQIQKLGLKRHSSLCSGTGNKPTTQNQTQKFREGVSPDVMGISAESTDMNLLENSWSPQRPNKAQPKLLTHRNRSQM